MLLPLRLVRLSLGTFLGTMHVISDTVIVHRETHKNMTSSMASATTQTISTVVFGIVATFISIIMVYQSYRAWKIRHGHNQQAEPRALGDALAVIGSERLLTFGRSRAWRAW